MSTGLVALNPHCSSNPPKLAPGSGPLFPGPKGPWSCASHYSSTGFNKHTAPHSFPSVLVPCPVPSSNRCTHLASWISHCNMPTHLLSPSWLALVLQSHNVIHKTLGPGTLPPTSCSPRPVTQFPRPGRLGTTPCSRWQFKHGLPQGGGLQ